MVLFKRKPVTFPSPPPLPDNLNIKSWYIPYTKEWFLTYDDYLQRMDYYNTKKFVCEITGNSCLTFFEAYDSEKKEMNTVEKCFPEHLKEPILRHLQFSTVPRIDQLVDEVYTSFKNDYYPGETVMIRLNDYKNDFKTKCVIREKAKFNAVNTSTASYPAHCKYRVARLDNGQEVVVDEHQVTRDRNNFTKWFVKTFIKLSVTRSPKLGAPWMVKQKYADKYRISTEFPPELIRFKEEKPKPSRKRLLLIRPKDGDNKKRQPAQERRAGTPGGNRKPSNILPKPGTITIKPEITVAPVVPKKVISEDLLQPFEFKLRKPLPSKIEDLGQYVEDALETWTFLNVYRVPLVLDSFTFDDFLTALKWKSSKLECPLLNEIFCSVLSAYLPENGTQLEIQFPEDYDQEYDEEEEQEEEDEEERNEENDVKEEAESTTAKKEKESKKSSKLKVANDIEEEDTNKVDEYLTDRIPWLERLSKRNFKDGSWQIVLLGILDEVRSHKAYKEDVKQIFDILAPMESGVNASSINGHFYHDLPLHLRIRALNLISSFLVNSVAIRTYLDKCMEESVQLRRERFENIREYKAAYDKAQDIDKECREAVGPSPLVNGTLPNTILTEQNASEADNKFRRRRKHSLTAEPSPEELEFAKTSSTFGNLLASRTKQLRIADELRLQRRNLEKKLAELDVQRIKYVGKDRLFNRYWWFESNGLPNLGGNKGSHEDDEDAPEEDDEDDEDDEVLEETYLMGRLWVQGPSSEDVEYGLKIKQELIKEWKDLNNVVEEKDNGETTPLAVKEEKTEDKIDVEETKKSEPQAPKKESNVLPELFVKNSKKVFKIAFEQDKGEIVSLLKGNTLVDEYGAVFSSINPVERKIIEEMPDPLLDNHEWRYYDKPEEIESLLKWLNVWGERESNLLKDISAIKDKIISSITARRKALKLDSTTEEEETILKTLNEIVLSDSEIESAESESDEENESDESELELPPAEVGEDEAPRTRRSIAEASKLAEERRRKEELIREKIAEREAKKARSKPSLRIAKREMKKRKIREHDEKKQLIADSKERLKQIKIDNETQRCLDWVNQSAIDSLGHSHYEGPKKIRSSGRRGGRK